MAQRATGFSKKKLEVVKTAFANDLPLVTAPPGPVAEPAPTTIRTLPLSLAALLTPYRRHGRLSLRVERVPQLARLSGGRNNGDGTWSLASDELEGLTYLVPEDLKEHALTVRIMAFDGSAAFTLKVLDVPISAGVTAPEAVPQREAMARSAAEGDGAAELQRLQDALAEARTALAFRETELAESRQESEQARRDTGNKDAELAAARAVWQASMDDRLSAVTAQVAGEIERARKTWQAEQDVRVATLESHAERRLIEAREQWQKESQSTVTRAEKGAKAREAERLAAAEVAWREKSARALAEVTERCEKLEASLAAERARALAAPSATETERALRQLHGELFEAKKSAAEGEKALAQLRADRDQAEEYSRQERESALAEAAQRCEKLEASLAAERARADAAPSTTETERALRQLQGELADARRAASEGEKTLAQLRADQGLAQERMRREHDSALAEAAQRCEKLEASLTAERARTDAAPSATETERALRQLHGELADARKAASEGETALAHLRAEKDQAEQGARRDSQTALSDAAARWKSEEAARLAAAETAWREQTARLLAEMTQRHAALESDLARERARPDLSAMLAERESTLERVRGDMAEIHGALAEREGMLAQLRLDGEQAQLRWRQELQAALDAAKAAWRAEEAMRSATAEAQWRARSEAEQALAKARCETAERALLEAVATTARARAGENGGARPDKELETLQALLKDREADLAQLRQDADEARARARQEQEASVANARATWQAEETAQRAAAHARGQEEAAAALATATARAEAAEAALSRARNRTAERNSDDAYVDRLRKELAGAQATLVDREAELVRARSTVEQARARPWPDNNLVVGGSYDSRDGRRAASSSNLLRDAIVLMAIAMAAILLWPKLESYLPDEWRYQIDTVTAGVGAPRTAAAPAQAGAPPTSPAAATQETATVAKAVNMRADASVSGTVVLTLPRGAPVAVIERRGNWTRVGYIALDGTGQQQGWVWSTYLRAPAPGDAKTSPGDSLRP